MRSIVLRLAVIALLVYAGVTFWYNRMEERLRDRPHPVAAQKEETVPPARPEAEESAPEATDYSVIVTRNIFQAGAGSAGRQGAFSQTDEDGLAQTRLRLVLLGTVTGGADDARAIIRNEQTRQEDLYRTGSEIQGARINRINRGRVILLVNGQEEVLTIKDPGSERQDGGSEQRVSVRNVEIVPERMERAPAAASGEIENKVPEAQPKRRISFRNTAPQPAAVEQPVQLPGEEGQALPPGGGEAATADPNGEKPAEEPPQRQHDAPVSVKEVRAEQ